MGLLVPLLLVQSMVQAGQVGPVLEFPERGIDDPAAYDGYATRFFRDADRNTVQIYLNGRSGRTVHVWADATNASAAFTVKTRGGEPARMTWEGAGATIGRRGEARTMVHSLRAEEAEIEIGWFLLGTMRQERDFQYFERGLRPFDDEPWRLPEHDALLRALGRLPAAERDDHLALLHASDLDELRGRVTPAVTTGEDGDRWWALVSHTSLDDHDHLTIRLSGDARASEAEWTGDRLRVRAMRGEGVRVEVEISSDAEVLEPLPRSALFNDAFGGFYAARRAEGGPAFRRLERGTIGLELIASTGKLMASLPNYATYFGRDQMMAALMLEPVLAVDAQEAVLGAVLNKLHPLGGVSHEEALGGQAIRESAGDYASLVDRWAAADDPTTRAELLARARDVLVNVRMVRENHHMVDDDLQFPVLLARYLSRTDVPDARKRAFLSRTRADGTTFLDAVAANLAFVAAAARPYAADPVATNLVGFPRPDGEGGWYAGSWRDSREGYGRAKYGMDVNVVWVPSALEASQRVLDALRALDLPAEAALDGFEGDASALRRYLRDPASLRADVSTWSMSRRHFEVDLTAAEVQADLERWLGELGPADRAYWAPRADAGGRGLHFLAVALDDDGEPVRVANSDPATELFLGDHTERVLRGELEGQDVLELLEVFARPFPVGLVIEGLGPVVANDVYATATIRERFRRDAYHAPTVVWGREVNLLVLGVARQLAAAYDEAGRLRDDSRTFADYVDGLRAILERTQGAVEASGMRHNELWSYRIEGNALRPVRYGASSDIQLWNLTDLAVEYLLDRLPAASPPGREIPG